MSKMDNITEVCTDDFYVSVCPGVSRMTLNKYLRETGLFFPIGNNKIITLYSGMGSGLSTS